MFEDCIHLRRRCEGLDGCRVWATIHKVPFPPVNFHVLSSSNATIHSASHPTVGRSDHLDLGLTNRPSCKARLPRFEDDR